MSKGGDVGYCNPPKAHQFKKGHSGNPKGRPKAAGRLEHIFLDELERPITIRQKGRSRTLDPRLAIALAVAAKAVKPDVKAIKLLFQIVENSQSAAAVEDRYGSHTGSRWELTEEERKQLHLGVEGEQPT